MALGMFTTSSRSTDLYFPVTQNNFRTWDIEKIPCKKDLIKKGCHWVEARWDDGLL
jgi:hypothetical protein